ncbi:tetratricopeptide repeat protein [Yoonia sediminilitoris]|uniref:Uncharacterized protein n=1 Tax=Yoonia sediminilitoris TaxID=1286148 RepID=A0A2T6KJM2_9RHOB|nr:hypothetical protein [Yoonia sediminilitoris]PUB16164.1 hypothetical protein C8N45_10317 [Yoonia sediminilitoris]RCW96513.1 hypothetical protein DFP92_10317 [Yoonia sediminilitoris]
MKWIYSLCLLAAPAFAESCPPAAENSARTSQIITSLGRAQTQEQADLLGAELWALWTTAPDEPAQALLDDGMRKRSVYDFLGAQESFDRLVAYCPHYAEGYNQRAFASYLRQDYSAALIDLDKALALNPLHIAALSGKALTLIGLGRNDEAQVALREALALNPWLHERALLIGPVGTDL